MKIGKGKGRRRTIQVLLDGFGDILCTIVVLY